MDIGGKSKTLHSSVCRLCSDQSCSHFEGHFGSLGKVQLACQPVNGGIVCLTECSCISDVTLGLLWLSVPCYDQQRLEHSWCYCWAHSPVQ